MWCCYSSSSACNVLTCVHPYSCVAPVCLISSHCVDYRLNSPYAVLQAELSRRGLKLNPRGHSPPSSHYSFSADNATVLHEYYEMWLVTPLPSPVHFNHTQVVEQFYSGLMALCCISHVVIKFVHYSIQPPLWKQQSHRCT